MADAVQEQVENALNLVVTTTEQSGNMKKALKEKIYETVSTLRSLFLKLKTSGDDKMSAINNLTKQVGVLETELKQCRDKQDKVHQAPSVVDETALNDIVARKHATQSGAPCPEPTGPAMRSVVLPSNKSGRLYVEVVQRGRVPTHKLTVRSRGEQQPEAIKQLLKTKINPC